MSVSRTDAATVLKTILTTFNSYVCPGHPSPDADDLDVICDGTCMWTTAQKFGQAKTWAEIDATPTLYDHTQGEVSKGNWSIAWEGNAPDEWVFSEKLTENVRETTGGRVFIEPINTCILGVYPR
ncbi:hypothetical protein [Actinophytocola sp.]|uniref:hypothetical protein n=1 Tax=Actinophytocola sp. TaxID=1872138 RepID=UPI002D80E013|nr:hypothetical protein [Actinophytocola sp.]HET9144165.1 hypothetical protein [Actinophytocola sp.]